MQVILRTMLVVAFFSGICLAGENPELKTEKEKISYSIGYQVGGDFKRQGVELDTDLLVKGIRDAAGGAEPRVSPQEMRKTLVDLKKKVEADERKRRNEIAEKNRAEGEAFLAANGKKEGVVTLPSGLQYKVITTGTGPKPTLEQTVVCQYRGTLIDGKEFDSSYKRGQPATFPVNKVIKGWTEVLQLMPVGSKWQVFIPPDLAYGTRGAGADIGPNATLIFEIELVAIK